MAIVSEPDKQQEESRISLVEVIWSGVKFMTAMLLKIIISII
jgi:hypothetical protein